MKKLIVAIIITLLFTTPRGSAAVFQASSLPSQIGAENWSYLSTNNPNAPSLLIGYTNETGPLPPPFYATWNLAQPPQPYETIELEELVAPTNGAGEGEFRYATFAEQDSQICGGATNIIGWVYYGYTNGNRMIYGTCTPNTQAGEIMTFDPPLLDVPATVTNGQAWTNNSTINLTIWDASAVYAVYSSISVVDNFGYLALTNIGTVAGWRVHETDVYAGYEWEASILLETDELYYWLVPNLGEAAIVCFDGPNVKNPSVRDPYTNSVQRFCSANYYNLQAPAVPTNAVGNLHIALAGGAAHLSWVPFGSGVTNYNVEAASAPGATNWESLGLTAGTNWMDTPVATQRYYRVVGSP